VIPGGEDKNILKFHHLSRASAISKAPSTLKTSEFSSPRSIPIPPTRLQLSVQLHGQMLRIGSAQSKWVENGFKLKERITQKSAIEFMRSAGLDCCFLVPIFVYVSKADFQPPRIHELDVLTLKSQISYWRPYRPTQAFNLRYFPYPNRNSHK